MRPIYAFFGRNSSRTYGINEKKSEGNTVIPSFLVKKHAKKDKKQFMHCISIFFKQKHWKIFFFPPGQKHRKTLRWPIHTIFSVTRQMTKKKLDQKSIIALFGVFLNNDGMCLYKWKTSGYLKLMGSDKEYRHL